MTNSAWSQAARVTMATAACAGVEPAGGSRGAPPWIHAPASASPSATNALSSVSCRAAVATAFAHATLNTPQPSRRWSAFMTSSAKPVDNENAPTAASTQSVPYGSPHAATKRASGAGAASSTSETSTTNGRSLGGACVAQ